MKTRKIIGVGLAAVATAVFGWCLVGHTSKKDKPKRSLESNDEVREQALTTFLLQQPELSDYCQDEVSLPEIATPSVRPRPHSNPRRNRPMRSFPRLFTAYQKPIPDDKPKSPDIYRKVIMMSPNRDKKQRRKQLKIRSYEKHEQ